MKKENIIRAKKIVALEKKLQEDYNFKQEYYSEMTKLMENGLTLEDMIEIDNYITKKKLLTK